MRLHTRVRRGLAASALTMAGVMSWAGTAWAVPANDDRANAEVLALGATASGTTVGATLEQGETPVKCYPDGNGGSTVWYSVTSGPGTSRLQLVLSSATDQGVSLWDAAGTTMIACRDHRIGPRTTAGTSPLHRLPVWPSASTLSMRVAIAISPRALSACTDCRAADGRGGYAIRHSRTSSGFLIRSPGRVRRTISWG